MIDLTRMGQAAKQAAASLAGLTTDAKNAALAAIAARLEAATPEILAANASDLAAAAAAAPKFLDRLRLTPERVADLAAGVRAVAALPDPTARLDAGWVNHAGLTIQPRRVPLGVIGIIYEARPNVTVDAAALTLKSGNAVILRGGREAGRTNAALAAVIQAALSDCGLDPAAVQLVAAPGHESAQALMHLTGYVDVLIPRGSARLIQAVVQEATVPVIETGAGNCHVYVDAAADPDMAEAIVVNAKVQRPSVCNAAEKLLIHEAIAATAVPRLAQALAAHGVQLRGDAAACALWPGMVPATAADWDTEYNDLIMAVRVVPDLEAAIAHINRHGTGHSEAIVTGDYEASERFLAAVDAACVYVNASTRFTDGAEFGFGAEIGISTQKLHARGPMGLAQLTTIKYAIRGAGQVRD
ncbi:glutamate-5-semialdehyde dehydrogenase [Lacticaseibacillus kribbianus]|uniref:glutamate-5-semialdehyde dehydrogenase n=1 Tax=Lacticaseibacillus kribbianus TaxID=2926292 RepID=UPI001CD59E7D|nr:glutamate-5-semialdehyde dehydrogenase [Lacticaseibacillus kribbianus]